MDTHLQYSEQKKLLQFQKHKLFQRYINNLNYFCLKINNTVKMSDIKALDNRGLLKRNFDRPPIKDTINVPTGGYSVIRFIADNPGLWLLHCHMEAHAESGMSMILKVGQSKHLPAKPKNWPECGSYNHY
jgi:L-ascorbate oxidase